MTWDPTENNVFAIFCPNLSCSKTYLLSCQDEAEHRERLRPLCPTGWTVRARSLKMVIDNYSSLLQFFDEVAESDKTEAAAKASGLLQQCLQFDNFFILRLSYKVLSRTETVSSTGLPCTDNPGYNLYCRTVVLDPS